MHVTVKVHRDCEAEYLAWYEQNGNPPGTEALAQLLESELLDELRRKDGIPDGAVGRPHASPPYFVWRFNANTWIQYELFRVRGRLWGTSLKVVIRRVSRTPLP